VRRFDRSFLEPKQEDYRLVVTAGGLAERDEIAGLLANYFRNRPCPSPRPAGAPDAEQRTTVDAPQP
jgi:hypothetical protein